MWKLSFGNIEFGKLYIGKKYTIGVRELGPLTWTEAEIGPPLNITERDRMDFFL